MDLRDSQSISDPTQLGVLLQAGPEAVCSIYYLIIAPESEHPGFLISTTTSTPNHTYRPAKHDNPIDQELFCSNPCFVQAQCPDHFLI